MRGAEQFVEPRSWGVADKKLAKALDSEVMAESARAQVSGLAVVF